MSHLLVNLELDITAYIDHSCPQRLDICLACLSVCLTICLSLFVCMCFVCLFVGPLLPTVCANLHLFTPRLHMVTWNVGTAEPPRDVSSLLRLDSQPATDVYVIG